MDVRSHMEAHVLEAPSLTAPSTMSSALQVLHVPVTLHPGNSGNFVGKFPEFLWSDEHHHAYFPQNSRLGIRQGAVDFDGSGAKFTTGSL